MKKYAFLMILLIMSAGYSYAVSAPADDDAANLSQTRDKLIRMKKEMDAFMRDLAQPYMEQDKQGVGIFGQDVRVDVSENEKEIIVRADLPGMSKDKIDVSLENGRMLSISGSREIVRKEEQPGVVKQERSSGRFERTIELPADCENSGINASYKEGVLEVTLPKKKSAKKEAVKVNVQ